MWVCLMCSGVCVVLVGLVNGFRCSLWKKVLIMLLVCMVLVCLMCSL